MHTQPDGARAQERSGPDFRHDDNYGGAHSIDFFQPDSAEASSEWSSSYQVAYTIDGSGRTAEATAQLEPGIYSLECWVKNASGDILISHGMIRELTVTEEDSGASRPTADVQIDLGSDGIVMRDPLGRGRQTVALQLEEGESGRPVHNDVHLIRIAEDTDLAEVAAWLEWYDVERGLREPAPADFLGGFHAYGTMPPEGRAWFTLDVDQAGRYAWIVQADPEDERWKLVDVD